MKKKILISFAVVVAVIVAAFFGAGIYMVNYALKPGNRYAVDSDAVANMEQLYPGVGVWVDSLRSCGVLRDTLIVNDKGRALRAFYADAPDTDRCRGTVILSHGYTDSALRMSMLAKEYRENLGFNILMPDHEYHGASEGPAINMGWHDRINLERWMLVAEELWPGYPIFLHGISMGAATVMMCSGDELPASVVGIIEDCGYTSVWDEFSGQLKEKFGLPEHPVLDAASLVCRMRYGWGFKEASALKQVAKSTLPMLFIHGDGDSFVPSWMVTPLYEAKTVGYKQLWMPESDEHAQSYRMHPGEYMSQVRKFIDICLTENKI